MNVRIACEAWICWSFVQPSESRLWILTSIWTWSWDPLKLCDAIHLIPGNHDRYRDDFATPGSQTFGLMFEVPHMRKRDGDIGYWVKIKNNRKLAFVYADFALKIVALFSAIMVSAGGLFSVSSMVTGNAKIGGLDRNCLHRQTTRKRGPSPIGHWRETGCSLGYASLNYCRGETFLSSSAFLEAALLRGVSSKPRTLSACRTCNLNSCTSRYIRPRFENFSGPFD